MITIIIIFLVANTTTATTAAAASGTATTTTTTTSSALKKKVNVEKEHSKSMLQHVKNIRSEKQLNQMLGTLYIHLMDGWMDGWMLRMRLIHHSYLVLIISSHAYVGF